MSKIAYIHEITKQSKVNGPFNRTVIHFQGCTLNCPGCFNTSTHPMKNGIQHTVESLLKEIPKEQEHITISGGEPFLQASFLLDFVKACRENNYKIVVFSGFYKHEIEKMQEGKEVLKYIDVLIDGRFEENKQTNDLKGSNNQTVHLLTDVYTAKQFQKHQVEILIGPNGELRMTGFPTGNLINSIKENSSLLKE